MAKSRWKTALKTIYELAPYKDPKTAGMTPEDILGHMLFDFPGFTRKGVFCAISEAITKYGAPIETRPDPEKHRGVMYYVPLGARKKAQGIMASTPTPHWAAPGNIKQWEKVTAILLARPGRPLLTETILEKFKKEFPETDNRTVHAAMNTATNQHHIPICKKSVRGRMWYFIPAADYDAASAILLKNKQHIPPPIKPSSHPPGANNPPKKATGHPPAPKSQAPTRAESTLHLIRARAPRSLCAQDVADFFFISLEEATETLATTCKKYAHIVEVTIHAKIK